MIANTFLALGLVLIVEGLAYALAPSLVERMLEMMQQLPDGIRRQMGALAIVSGLLLVWAAYHLA
jgi:uncharacterized protein YjeT (DUF2065 family)